MELFFWTASSFCFSEKKNSKIYKVSSNMALAIFEKFVYSRNIE